MDELKVGLSSLGLEVLSNLKEQMTEKVKTAIIALVQYKSETLKVNLSSFLSEKLGADYQTLSTVFSELEQQTIEIFYPAENRKGERIVELRRKYIKRSFSSA